MLNRLDRLSCHCVDIEAGPHEDRLFNQLFNENKYFVTSRPVTNKTDSLQVKFGIRLVQIFELVWPQTTVSVVYKSFFQHHNGVSWTRLLLLCDKVASYASAGKTNLPGSAGIFFDSHCRVFRLSTAVSCDPLSHCRHSAGDRTAKVGQEIIVCTVLSSRVGLYVHGTAHAAMWLAIDPSPLFTAILCLLA